MDYYFYKIFWLIVIVSYPFFIRAEVGHCEGAFPSRLYFMNQIRESTTKDRELHSEFVNPMEEFRLPERWNEKPSVPPLLDFFLLEGVSYIGHQLARPESAEAVKLVNNDVVMARASYEDNANRTFATNVAFSPQVLLSNMRNKEGQKWLVGPDASAAVLFLHGMGMQTAGAHIARRTIRDFRRHFEDVHVLALDLPWHAEGHRESTEHSLHEIEILSAFVKKYIPPHVPLFVWGHSGGTVFAQRLMTMTDGPQGGAFFHPNLKGIMLFSPAADAAPGKSREEKYKAFSEGQKKGMSEFLSDRFTIKDPLQVQFFEDSNPLGELYGMWMITQLDSRMPSHRGKNYVPALMAVGEKDPLVFTGFPRSLFRDYYDELENMETHYFDRLPLLRNKQWEEVGHWLGDYMDPESGLPIQMALARKFMEKQGVTLKETDKGHKTSLPSFVDIKGTYSNNLAFREFFGQYRLLSAELNPDLQSLSRERNQRIKGEINEVLQKYDIDRALRGKIVGKIFSSLNLANLMEFLNAQSLPEPLLKEIVDYITGTGYFKVKQLAQGIYLPDKSELSERGFAKEEGAEIASYLLKNLSEAISNHSPLIQELLVLRKREGALKKEYQAARNSVRLAMELIAEALKKASDNPPPSLVSDFISIRNELESVMELGNEIPRLFERLSLQLDSFSIPHINELIKEYGEEKVNRFRQLHQQYDVSRRTLKRKLIWAISKGEMGPEYQQAVLEIYGQNLDGQGPLYSKLKNVNQELSQVEADIYNKNALYVRSLMRYQHEFGRLYTLLQPVKEGETDWIDIARNSYTFTDVSLHDILKRFSSDLLNDPTSHSFVGQRINDSYDTFFRNALDTWKQVNSHSLPELPVAPGNH